MLACSELGGTDDASLALSVRKSRSSPLYGSQASWSTDEHDLTCPTWVKELFLEKCKTRYYAFLANIWEVRR